MTEHGQPRRDEGASFTGATARGRARPPVFLLAFLAVLGGVAVAGYGGRTNDSNRTPAPPAAAASTLAATGVDSAAPTPAAIPSPLPAGSMPAPRPVVSSEPGPIVLRARRNAATVYVHGDVFAQRVTWIYVALQDASGRVAGWTSVSMPDPGPNAATGDGPPVLFDVELGVPLDTYPGMIFVFAHAHDADGALVGTAQLELLP